MSKKPIEGESAFPSDRYGQTGLTERRYYIGQALQGFCTNTSFMVDTSYEAIAAMAIQQADAVMALLYPAEASEPDKPEALQAVNPPPDHRQLKVGELKRPGDLVRLLDGSFTTIDGYGEDGKLVQEGEIRFRKSKFAKGDQVVYMPSARASPELNDVWEVVGVSKSGVSCILRQRQLNGKLIEKPAIAEELAPIDRECPF